MVGGITGRGILLLIKVLNIVKVNLQYSIDNALKTCFEREIPRIHPNAEGKVTLHHDKESSHVVKLTIQYFKNLRSKGGQYYIRKENIATKSPDISPMDFPGFVCLKQKDFSRKGKTIN